MKHWCAPLSHGETPDWMVLAGTGRWTRRNSRHESEGASSGKARAPSIIRSWTGNPRWARKSRTAGICIEWIQGEGGVVPIAHEFSRRARELADKYDALLCFDEIQCGVGRPGTWFGYQLVDPPVMPDIVIAAKPNPEPR